MFDKFFKSGGVVEVNPEIKALENEIEKLKKRVLMVECPHEIRDLGFEEWFSFGNFMDFCVGRKYCKRCGKTIENYSNIPSFLKAKNKLMRELIALNEKEMKGK